MLVELDQLGYFPFSIRDPATGNSVAPDSVSGEAYEEGALIPLALTDELLIKSLTATGQYTVELTINPTFFTLGKTYIVRIKATVGDVTDETQIATFQVSAVNHGTAIDDTIKSRAAQQYLPQVAPGAAGGVFIAGSNAATTVATWTVSGTTNFTGAVVFGSTWDVIGGIVFDTLDIAGLFNATLTGNVDGNVTGSVGSVVAPVDANITQWLGTAPVTPTVPGVPVVDLTHILGDPVEVAGTVDANIVAIDTAVNDLIAANMWAEVFYGKAASEIIAIAAAGAGAGVVDTGAPWNAAESRSEAFLHVDGTTPAFTTLADREGNRQSVTFP